MIIKNFEELDCLMLHAKIQTHTCRPSGAGEEDFKVLLLFIAIAAMAMTHYHSVGLILTDSSS